MVGSVTLRESFHRRGGAVTGGGRAPYFSGRLLVAALTAVGHGDGAFLHSFKVAFDFAFATVSHLVWFLEFQEVDDDSNDDGNEHQTTDH